MREIQLGEITVPIAASPITLYIYSREFGPKADLIGDLLGFQAVADNRPETARFLVLLQVLWAMCKTARLGSDFPNFEEWLKRNQDIDMGDEVLWDAVMTEAVRGLFRSAAAAESERQS